MTMRRKGYQADYRCMSRVSAFSHYSSLNLYILIKHNILHVDCVTRNRYYLVEIIRSVPLMLLIISHKTTIIYKGEYMKRC